MKTRAFFALLWLLRFRLFSRLFGYRALLWLLDFVGANYRLHIPVIIGALITSRSADYTRLMLRVLAALPENERESHEHLRGLFISESLHSTSVTEGLAVCRSAVTLCFLA